MTLEDSIISAVSSALANKYVHPVLVYASREEASATLGVSPQSFDRLFEAGVLTMSQHTTQFRKRGRTMYYIPEILKTLQPTKAIIKLFGDQGR